MEAPFGLMVMLQIAASPETQVSRSLCCKVDLALA
jgi:hypothetical protein